MERSAEEPGGIDRSDATHAIASDGRSETPNERADRNWNEILQELRVAQTGTQILGGFLLAVAFQPRFAELDPYQLALYLGLVALAGTAAVLGLAPVSLHRFYFGHRVKQRVVRVGARLLVAHLIAVATLAVGVTCLIFDVVLGRGAGIAALAAGAAIVAVLWALIPRLGVGRKHAAEPDSASESADTRGAR